MEIPLHSFLYKKNRLQQIKGFELTPFFKQSIPLKLTSGITHNF